VAGTFKTSSYFWQDTVLTGLIAAATSGAPSTLWAWWSGGDVFEATRAAGAMLISVHSSAVKLFAAAAIVHLSVSLLWAGVLTAVLPRQHVVIAALIAAAAIAVLDLRIIGSLFPEIYALPFWPQFADHLAWGITAGAVLQWRFRARCRQA
jgi:hypothetical protein